MVEVKNVDLPTDRQRAMRGKAEAEREKPAKIIHAAGELRLLSWPRRRHHLRELGRLQLGRDVTSLGGEELPSSFRPGDPPRFLKKGLPGSLNRRFCESHEPVTTRSP